MNIHNRTFHEKDPKYKCDICGLQALHKFNLARHKKIVHEWVKHKKAVHEGVKYPCGQCGEQFTQKGNLAKHKREVHEGVKYPCGQCGQEFTRKESLAKHQKAVHRIFI